MEVYQIPSLPLSIDLETKIILKQVNLANKKLAELKGIAQTIPNESILINTLFLQEAKDSSAVENIVTTHDDLYQADISVSEFLISAATKEVLNYRKAIAAGFDAIRHTKLLTNNVIQRIQSILVGNTAGFRKVPGTVLKDYQGNIIYTPPQDATIVASRMEELENFINTEDANNLDPLIKLAIIHHQFESIHPFYDGNGRTGRIIAILLLVTNDLLDLPILYLSRYITHNKSAYYQKIQAIRETSENEQQWQDWVLFILKGIEETATNTILLVKQIKNLMIEEKTILKREFGKLYRHELLNHLFYHPYTRIEYTEEALQIQRLTATKYLNRLVGIGLLTKVKKGRKNYYINTKLVEVLMNQAAISKELQPSLKT